jgi:hypothetical protein
VPAGRYELERNLLSVGVSEEERSRQWSCHWFIAVNNLQPLLCSNQYWPSHYATVFSGLPDNKSLEPLWSFVQNVGTNVTKRRATSSTLCLVLSATSSLATTDKLITRQVPSVLVNWVLIVVYRGCKVNLGALANLDCQYTMESSWNQT